MAAQMKRRRVSGGGQAAVVPTAVPSLAAAHRLKPGDVVETISACLAYAGEVRNVGRAGAVCDLVLADATMWMQVTLLVSGCCGGRDQDEIWVELFCWALEGVLLGGLRRDWLDCR